MGYLFSSTTFIPLVNNHQDIIDKHVDGHGEQDDTEEFTDDEDEVGAQQFLDFV